MNRSQRRIDNVILLVNIITFVPSILFHIVGLYISINLNYQLFIIYIGFLLILINFLFIIQLKNYNNFGNLRNYDSQNTILRSCLFLANIVSLYFYVYFDLQFKFTVFFLISVILNSLILCIPYLIIITFFLMLAYCMPNLILEPNDNPNGLSLDQINQLRLHQIPIDLNDRCNICLSQIKSGETIRILECNHNFHSECLDKWLIENDTCPNCRTIISDNIDNL